MRWAVQCVPYIVQWLICIVHYVLCSVYLVLCNVYFSLFNVYLFLLFILCIVRWVLFCAMCTLYCAFCTLYCVLCTVEYCNNCDIDNRDIGSSQRHPRLVGCNCWGEPRDGRKKLVKNYENSDSINSCRTNWNCVVFESAENSCPISLQVNFNIFLTNLHVTVDRCGLRLISWQQ